MHLCLTPGDTKIRVHTATSSRGERASHERRVSQSCEAEGVRTGSPLGPDQQFPPPLGRGSSQLSAAASPAPAWRQAAGRSALLGKPETACAVETGEGRCGGLSGHPLCGNVLNRPCEVGGSVSVSDEKIKVQRGQDTCLRSHSSGCEFESIRLQSPALPAGPRGIP